MESSCNFSGGRPEPPLTRARKRQHSYREDSRVTVLSASDDFLKDVVHHVLFARIGRVQQPEAKQFIEAVARNLVKAIQGPLLLASQERDADIVNDSKTRVRRLLQQRQRSVKIAAFSVVFRKPCNRCTTAHFESAGQDVGQFEKLIGFSILIESMRNSTTNVIKQQKLLLQEQVVWVEC